MCATTAPKPKQAKIRAKSGVRMICMYIDKQKVRNKHQKLETSNKQNTSKSDARQGKVKTEGVPGRIIRTVYIYTAAAVCNITKTETSKKSKSEV